ncbi:hypothetical protein [Nisaea nitritireducens]|uniref:hypothetical protein n=1 Tax=Nisaea nitritireducens TaxID=568392 RepID=UPI0018684535|nr:hypothetical protein [Nisaea nitritireducens]
MDHIERKSLKILADSTRENQGDSDLTRNLDAAAETGDREEYHRARDSFDSLPPEERRSIGSGAVEQAETVRIEAKLSKATRGRPAPAEAEEERDMLGLDWVLGKSEGTPVPAGKKKTQLRDPKTPRPTAQAPLPDDGEGNWNWQALPDDPTLRNGSTEKDPLQELREQLLGPGSGQTWRRSPPSGE